MSTARRHHYLQARYLDGFLASPDKKLWCYGRGRSVPFHKVPDELAHQRDLYRFPNAPPEKNLETFLSSSVEGPGLTALLALVGQRQPLDIERRIRLTRYIAFQELRVPHMREVFREQVSRSIDNMMQRFKMTGGHRATVQYGALAEGVVVKKDDPFEVDREDIESFAKDIAENPETFDLEQMVDFANDITIFFAQMRWTVLFARPSTAFITSDCSVFRTFTEPGGDDALLRPDCSVCCPLSSQALLVMDHDFEFLKVLREETKVGNGETLPPTRFRTITDSGVANFNRKIAAHAHLWCFSGKEQSWLREAMQGLSSRRRPEFFAEGPMSSARWRRAD